MSNGNDQQKTDREEKDEKYKVAVTQGDIREIKRDVTNLAQKVNQIHSALIGSELVQDGGIVKRVKDCEDALETLTDKVDAAQLAAEKKEFYVRWIWGLISFIIGSAVVEFLRYLSPTKK